MPLLCINGEDQKYGLLERGQRIQRHLQLQHTTSINWVFILTIDHSDLGLVIQLGPCHHNVDYKISRGVAPRDNLSGGILVILSLYKTQRFVNFKRLGGARIQLIQIVESHHRKQLSKVPSHTSYFVFNKLCQ